MVSCRPTSLFFRTPPGHKPRGGAENIAKNACGALGIVGGEPPQDSRWPWVMASGSSHTAPLSLRRKRLSLKWRIGLFGRAVGGICVVCVDDGDATDAVGLQQSFE
jgi:hypothetical protein